MHSDVFSACTADGVVCCVSFYGVPFVAGEVFEVGCVNDGVFVLGEWDQSCGCVGRLFGGIGLAVEFAGVGWVHYVPLGAEAFFVVADEDGSWQADSEMRMIAITACILFLQTLTSSFNRLLYKG